MLDLPRRATAPGVHPDAPELRVENLPVSELMVATPMGGGGVCDMHYMLGMMQLRTALAERGIPMSYVGLRHQSQVHAGRNECVARFLASDASHLLFIDSDIGFSADGVLRLLAHRKPVVGAAYRMKEAGVRRYAFLPMAAAPRTPEGLVEVQGLPGGFLMLTRAALERMAGAYRHLRHGRKLGDGAPEPWDQHLFQLFGNEIAEGLEWGEDLTFCRRWRALGGQVWLDPHILLEHWGMTSFCGHPAEAFTAEPPK